VAVFDLDGTVTRRDTLLPYVMGFLWRHPLRLPRMLGVLPACVRFVLGRADHGALKAAFIHATLGGVTRAKLKEWTNHYVPQLLADGLLQDARQRVERHRSRGDYLVLLSASTDLYVPEIATALGFTEAICTGVEWRDDVLVGHLTTPNRRGEEKVRCFERLRAQHPLRRFAAYGNAGTDIAHLRMADRPLLVNGSRSARATARRLGIPQATWH
jgi:HAD superfamily hydrolase (TIGR01490 family)